jgi:iron(III) transport system permease protein
VPVLTIGVLALQSSGNTWPHLIANVLPGAVRRTLALMAGVGALTLLLVMGTARLVTIYRFPGRGLFQWMLLLPLAIPTYIIAHCYLELFDYSGVLQPGLRQLFGWHSAKDYWFPNIRSVGGAIFVMNAVLYPYVYITARASLLAQSALTQSAQHGLGRGRSGGRGTLDKSIKSGAGLAISGLSG